MAFEGDKASLKVIIAFLLTPFCPIVLRWLLFSFYHRQEQNNIDEAGYLFGEKRWKWKMSGGIYFECYDRDHPGLL